MPVIRYSYSLFVVHLFVSYYSLLFVQLFYSLFDYSFCFIFIWVLLIVVQKKKNNSDPELCSGIFDPVQVPAIQQVPVTCSPPSSRVNKHHTADSTNFVLVWEAKEPITIIDKGDRRNQYSPYINLSRVRDTNYRYLKIANPFDLKKFHYKRYIDTLDSLYICLYFNPNPCGWGRIWLPKLRTDITPNRLK